MISYRHTFLVVIKFIKNNNNNAYEVPSSVPQGTRIAPILFILYINDEHITHSKVLLFADDFKIYLCIKSTDGAKRLQLNFDLLTKEWCSPNDLSLNITKCKQITFTRSQRYISFNYNINGNPFNTVDHFKYLSVI